MLKQRRTRPRDQSAERRERLRYQLLEQVYLLTGPSPERSARGQQLEDELGLSLDAYAGVVDDLERLGFLTRGGPGAGLRITERGIEYLRRGAWRRQSVRT